VLPLEETCMRIGSGDRTEKDWVRSVLGKSLVVDNVEYEWEGSDDKDVSRRAAVGAGDLVGGVLIVSELDRKVSSLSERRKEIGGRYSPCHPLRDSELNQ
jgi:hypothetical protein